MSTEIDVTTSNDDIFSNPLEAFPEFIDEPVPAQASSSEPEKAPDMPEVSSDQENTVKQTEIKEEEKTRIPRTSSASFIDPLELIEEVDLSSLASEFADLPFEDETESPFEDDALSSFSTKSNLTFGSISYEDVAVRKTDDLFDIDDSVPDASTVTEEVSVDDFLSPSGNDTEEVDLDDFLGASGFTGSAAPSAPAGNVTEEISLDDFGVDFGSVDAAAINAFASSSRQEKNDIENAPAIEMELEFDDDFVLETKANPEDDIDFDFEALMAGESVAVLQQTSSGDELLDNFDDIFDNIVDETAPAQEKASETVEFDPSAIEEVSLDDFGIGGGASSSVSESREAVSEQKIVYDEVSEFDDLLSSFSDETHVEVAEKQQNVRTSAGPHDYNIIVIMDDDDDVSTVIQTPVTQETEEEDYNISLFKTEEDAELFRRHESPSTSETPMQSDTALPHPVNTPSDTFEDISLDDFGVEFTDETPEAQKKTEILEEEPDMPAEPELRIEETPEIPDIPEEEPDFTADTLPEMPDLPDIPSEEVETDASTPEECEDTTVDDKKNVDMSDYCGYNGDNTEDISTMTDVNNEEMTDTMNEGLLEKIVSELSVLRNEMQTLRDEVQTLKGGEPVAASETQSEDFALPDMDSEPVPEEAGMSPEPSVEETIAEEAVSDDAFTEEPVIEETSEEASFDMPAPEADTAADIPLPEADPFAAPQEAGGFFSGDDDDETIALSGDELNNILNSADFTHEDGSNFGMDAPEGSVLPDGLDDGLSMDAPVEGEPAAEEPVFEESAPAVEEPVFEESAPAAEEPVFEESAPAVEEPSFDIPAEEESAPSDDLDINFDEPAAEAPAEDNPVEEAAIDDFNTDLPSLKDETVAAEESAEPSQDDFSLDDLDIPEPSVDENSLADFDIDEPDSEPKAEESFSLDEFDIPEPSVEESSIADIDIDEPASDIPSEEPAISDSATTEDSDFYANSDNPVISEEDVSGIGIQENLEEPVLDDIDFNMDEPQSEDIDIPTGESLVVDSSSTDFLEEDDPTLDEQLTSDKVDYLNEEAAVDDLGVVSEEEDITAVEGMEDSLEADTIATSEDETPADDMFSSQWDEGPSSTEDITEDIAVDAPAETAPSFDEETGEEIVHAASSFDDPIDFGIEDESAKEEDSSLDAGISFDEPETDIPTEEPAFEAPVEETAEPSFDAGSSEPASVGTDGGLDGDIKQEVKSVLKYMDQLLENLPEDKIAEFAQSEHFETYKKLFNELGLV